MRDLINSVANFLGELKAVAEKLVFDTRFTLYGFFIAQLAITTGISLSWSLTLLPLVLYADKKMEFGEWEYD